MDFAVGILPALLQEQDALAHILSAQRLPLAESRFADALPSRREVLVVELHSLGLLGEGDAGIHLGHRVGRAGDGFLQGAQEDAARCEDGYVDDSESLALENLGAELGALSACVLVGEDAGVRFHYAGHFGVGIAAPPGRAALVCIGTGTVEGSLRADFVDCLFLSSDDCALLDGTCYPRFKVAEANQFLFCREVGGEQAADGCKE